jgi:hypothetical protein
VSEPTICARCKHCNFLPEWFCGEGSRIPIKEYSWCIFGLHQVSIVDYVTGLGDVRWSAEPPKCSEKNDKGECPDYDLKPEPIKPLIVAKQEVVYIPDEPKHWWQR